MDRTKKGSGLVQPKRGRGNDRDRTIGWGGVMIGIESKEGKV